MTAFDMLRSPRLREALDLSKEPEDIVKRYTANDPEKIDYTNDGNSKHFLMARRLTPLRIELAQGREGLSAPGWGAGGRVVGMGYGLRSVGSLRNGIESAKPPRALHATAAPRSSCRTKRPTPWPRSSRATW